MKKKEISLPSESGIPSSNFYDDSDDKSQDHNGAAIMKNDTRNSQNGTPRGTIFEHSLNDS